MSTAGVSNFYTREETMLSWLCSIRDKVKCIVI